MIGRLGPRMGLNITGTTMEQDYNRLRKEHEQLLQAMEAIGAGGVGPQRITRRAERSDGSTAGYYELPEGATQLQDLISHRNMNAQIGEIFRSCYRYGSAEHSPQIRDIKKIIFYATAELERLEKEQV